MPFTFILKKLVASLLLPPASLILLAGLGLVLSRAKRPGVQRVGVGLAALSLVVLFAFTLPFVGNGLLRSLEDYPPLDPKSLPASLKGVEAIVVLGGGLHHRGPEYGKSYPNDYSLERVRYGAFLARASGLPLLVTGGAPMGGAPEAEAMAQVLAEDFRQPARWVEAASLDTVENARLSAPLLKAAGVKRIALISHGWHLPRAVPLFEAEGFSVLPAPTGFTTVKQNWQFPNDMRKAYIASREYLGLLFYQFSRPTETPPATP